MRGTSSAPTPSGGPARWSSGLVRRARSLAAVVLAVGALSLTGCGSSAPSGTGSVSPSPAAIYGFPKQAAFSTASGKMVIRVPQSLQAPMRRQKERLTVAAYTITARELGSADYCAFDAIIVYYDRGKDALSPPAGNRAQSLGLTEALDLEALDTDNPQAGVYLDEPRDTLTVVQPCASDPQDSSAAHVLHFPIIDAQGQTTDLAWAGVTIMKDGTLGIADSQIKEYPSGG